MTNFIVQNDLYFEHQAFYAQPLHYKPDSSEHDPVLRRERKADSRSTASEEIQPSRFQIKKDHTKLNKTKSHLKSEMALYMM